MATDREMKIFGNESLVLRITNHYPYIKLLIQWHETLSFSYYITLRLKIMKILEHLLCPDKSVKPVVTPPPMISYRNARNLSSYLARVNHLERKKGSY